MMNPIDEGRWIAEAVRQTCLQAELPWPPESPGPVPLDRLIGAYPLVHEEVPGLNHAAASALLSRWGVRWANIPRPDPTLAGFLYANARSGYIFIRRGDGLPRRRFTAAHELGHYRLHLAPALAQCDPADAEMTQSDEQIAESGEDDLTAKERQANRFAAELIMPEALCRTLFDRYASRYGRTARFLVHHLAGELLVSREAIAWRLYGLGLIEKPTWLAKGRQPGDAAQTPEAD
jgi:Zn-dependent peptidase ImmA (M78 family)